MADRQVDEWGRLILGRFTGPAVPARGPDVHGVLGPRTDAEVVASSMYVLLSTQKDTVPYAPAMGSIVQGMLFEPMNQATLGLLRYYILKDIRQQEPRADVQSIAVQQIGDRSIVVSISYKVRGDPLDREYKAPMTFNFEG